MAEIAPGSADRRYDPEIGLGKHRERIHRESKRSDEKNLPFTFSKPKRGSPSNVLYECEECGDELFSGKNTFMVICTTCKAVRKVVKV